MIIDPQRPTPETKPILSPVSLPKGSPASTPGKYTRYLSLIDALVWQHPLVMDLMA